MKKQAIFLLTMSLIIVGSFSACIEHRYYRQHQQHSPEYMNRHHQGDNDHRDRDEHHK